MGNGLTRIMLMKSMNHIAGYADVIGTVSTAKHIYEPLKPVF